MRIHVDTVIVGGGQAGLSVSYYPSQRACDHVVLEQSDKPVEAWRNHRWDWFTLNTPNWQTRLPGAEYDGANPDGFMSRNDVVKYGSLWCPRRTGGAKRNDRLVPDPHQRGPPLHRLERRHRHGPLPNAQGAPLQRGTAIGHTTGSLRRLPQSARTPIWRGAGCGQRPIRCPDCRGALSR